MSRPFDATLKHLIEAYPADWLQQLGLNTGQGIDVVDADLSTLTTQSDKVLRVRDAQPWLAQIELQASRDDTLVRRLLRYNVLLHDRHELAVHSAVVLLRPQAEAPGMDGRYRYEAPGGASYTEIRYQVIRIWEEQPEKLLAGGLGTLPLVPLCATNEQTLPPLIHRMEDRIQDEGRPHQRDELWSATYILMGLRYPDEFAEHILRGVRDMEESVTYQAILRKGEAEGEAKGKAKGEILGSINEARKLLFKLATRRFNAEPPAHIKAAIDAITDLDRLELLIERHWDVAGWDELVESKA